MVYFYSRGDTLFSPCIDGETCAELFTNVTFDSSMMFIFIVHSKVRKTDSKSSQKLIRKVPKTILYAWYPKHCDKGRRFVLVQLKDYRGLYLPFSPSYDEEKRSINKAWTITVREHNNHFWINVTFERAWKHWRIWKRFCVACIKVFLIQKVQQSFPQLSSRLLMDLVERDVVGSMYSESLGILRYFVTSMNKFKTCSGAHFAKRKHSARETTTDRIRIL